MNRYKVTFSDDTIMRLYAEIQDKVSLVKILGEYYRGYKKAYEWLIFLVDNDSIKNFRKAAMCNINEHNTLISFFFKMQGEYINVSSIPYSNNQRKPP